MHASVTVRTPDGQEHILVHGDLIGRVWSAALRLDDARVSEAHAMVSLRGESLQLLALRGLFAVGGKPVKALPLAAGQRIELARGVALDVLDVTLPERILVLEGPEVGVCPLSGVMSLVLSPTPRLRAGARDHAVAVFYLGAGGWRVRTDDGTADAAPGWSLDTPRGRYTLAFAPTAQAGEATRVQGAVQAPLRLVTRYDSILLQRDGQPTLRITGMPARLVSELADIGTAVHWESLARQLWPDDADVVPLRKRFDAVLSRLRGKLRQGGVRTDLVRSDHSGLFALVLTEADELVAES
jgi:hypothetical protein